MPEGPVPEDSVSATLQTWAAREVAPWRGQALRRLAVERHLHALAHRHANIRLFHFVERTVYLLPLPPGANVKKEETARAERYLRFFREVALLLPADFSVSLCLSTADMLSMATKLPVFAFQRQDGTARPLVPDIDFLVNNFYESAQFRDDTPYADKRIHAVFSGTTTGGFIDETVARTRGTPRLRAAHAFQDNPDIDFRLPRLSPYIEGETRRILEDYPFCQRPVLTWKEQFASRFLISIDGNGATCSRVVVALASNSVLLKYTSSHMLYYFPDLVPHEHFVPIEDDAEIPKVIAAERAEPGRFEKISLAARGFAARYLTRARVLEYTARLLTGYAALMSDDEEAANDPPLRDWVAFAKYADGSELRADAQGWAGRMGSGIPLTGFMVRRRPVGSMPHLLCQAFFATGGFTPLTRDGLWCGAADFGQPLSGIRLAGTACGGGRPVVLQVAFCDGSLSQPCGVDTVCRGAGGALVEAVRVG